MRLKISVPGLWFAISSAFQPPPISQRSQIITRGYGRYPARPPHRRVRPFAPLSRDRVACHSASAQSSRTTQPARPAQHHGGLVQAYARDSRLAPEVQQRGDVKFLVLSAAVVVFLGLCWLLSHLTRRDGDDTAMPWWHVALTAVFSAASVALSPPTWSSSRSRARSRRGRPPPLIRPARSRRAGRWA